MEIKVVKQAKRYKIKLCSKIDSYTLNWSIYIDEPINMITCNNELLQFMEDNINFPSIYGSFTIDDCMDVPNFEYRDNELHLSTVSEDKIHLVFDREEGMKLLREINNQLSNFLCIKNMSMIHSH